jgi:cathepsin L
MFFGENSRSCLSDDLWGGAGGCWAFSAVAAIEGVNAIVTGNLVSLSEQEIIDCDTLDSGCNGGQMENAFQYVVDNGGIDSESDYPFLGTDGTCDANKVGTVLSSSSKVKLLASLVFSTNNGEIVLIVRCRRTMQRLPP